VDRDSVDAIETAWRRERPDVDSRSIGIVTRIWRLGRVFDRARADALADAGVDASTLDALATLRRAGRPYRLTAGEMRRRSLVTAGAVSQRLDKLEAAGLVRRVPAEDDRRVVWVELTPRGIRTVDRAFAIVMAHEARLLAGLTRQERRDLTVVLRRWLHWFESSDVAPWRAETR
jgi:DNA-binding MarR family transcriptional regulator